MTNSCPLTISQEKEDTEGIYFLAQQWLELEGIEFDAISNNSKNKKMPGPAMATRCEGRSWFMAAVTWAGGGPGGFSLRLCCLLSTFWTSGLCSAACAAPESLPCVFQESDAKGEAEVMVCLTVWQRDRYILCCCPCGFSKMCGFDVRFIWQRGRDSREAGPYQHEMNGRERWVERGEMQLECTAKMGFNCFSRPPRLSFLFWHRKMKEAFPAQSVSIWGGCLMAQMVKNPPANAGDMGSIPGSGRFSGKGNGNQLQ